MVLSIDESIAKLKAEILSPDWNIAARKIDPLEAAFTCLKNRFKTRKNALAILTMGDSVLQYIKKKDDPEPEFVDFLKETMAHVVNLYEESKFDPDSEKELFKRIYARFEILKKKVKAQKGTKTPAPVAKKQVVAKPAPPQSDKPPVCAKQNPPTQPPTPPAPKPTANAAVEANDYQPTPGTLVRELTIGSMVILVEEKHISLVRPLKEKKKRAYIKNSQIPLKDFNKLLGGLSTQFQGEMGQLKDKQLKKLVLPLLIPRGIGLLTLPDDNAQELVVLSSGSWHGVVICSSIGTGPEAVASFSKAKNGDIAGSARLEDEREIPILNIDVILEREGFLSMPE